MTLIGAKVVMVIEDDEDTRLSLVELLESWGLVILPARDAEAGLRMLREGCEPTAILLDLMMPRMSGCEFRCEQIADSRLSKIPVVVMTALGTVPEADVAKMGRVSWLRKPFSPPALAHALATAVESTD